MADATTFAGPPISRRRFIQGLSVLPLAGLSLAACSEGEAAGGWVLSSGNPVLGGAYGVCFDPCVLRLDGVYRMWFSWRTQRAIGYTESSDGAIWSPPKTVVAADPSVPGQIEVNRPTVLIRDGVYHIWFTGQSDKNSEIYYATGANGLNWTRAQSAPVLVSSLAWEKTSVMVPDVIPDADEKLLRMYYSAGGQYEPDCIGLATSADGIDWQKRPNPVFLPDPGRRWEQAKVTASDVHRVGDWYIMFYIGFADSDHASICLARSRNGIDAWQRHPANPILQAPGMLNPFAWDRDAIYKPSAVMTDDGWTLFFNARRHRTEQIGMATHAGLDLGFGS